MTLQTGPDRLAVDRDTGTLKRRSVRGAAVMFGAQGVRFAMQFGAQLVLAHLLDPAQFGLIAMTGPVLSLVQIFNELGLTQATIQRPEISHRELSTVFWINLAVSACLALLMVLGAPLVAWFYGEPRLTAVMASLAGLLVLSGLAAQQMALLTRRMQFALLAVVDVACISVATAVGIGAAWLGAGYWSLVLMQAANSLAIVALAWSFSDWRPSAPRRASDALALLRFGGHLTGFNVLGFIEINLSSVLIGKLDGGVALGLYDRAFKLVIVPWWQINLPLARVAIALLSRLWGSEPLYVRAYQQMLQGLLLVAAPGLVWAAATSEALVPALLGREWVGAVPVVACFSIAATFMPFGSSAYWLFVSQGRVKEQLRYGYVGAALALASLLVGAPWGPVGIAASYAVFVLPMQGIQLWGATRRGPVSLPSVLRAAYPIAVALAVAAATVLVCERRLQEAQVEVYLRLGAGLLLAYGACGAALLCLPDGVQILRGVWALRHAFRRVPTPG